MTEWWSYSLRDLLLFSPRTYYRLFELYNLDVWPLQLVTVAAGVAILLLWRYGNQNAGRIIAALLALCCLCVAWAYHWQRYANINWAASYFAVAFAFEALFLFWLGVVRGRFIIYVVPGKRQRLGLTRQYLGLGLIAFALFGYPLLAPVLGRSWLQTEIFGIAPDPTALAILGTLLLYRARPLWWLYPVPVIWCLVSGATLWAMSSTEFFLLPLAALGLGGIAVAGSWKQYISR